MAHEFHLPTFGSGVKEAQILRWLVNEGDQVTTEQMLCEVETEKSVIEIPVPFDGTVLRLAANEGDILDVGDVLTVIGDATEDLGSAAASRPKIMPAVRRMAREHNIDLSAVHGTGPGGRITRQDLEAVIRGEPAVPIRESATLGPAAGKERAPKGESRKLSMLRKTIAEHMTRSWQEIPHVFARIDADATRFLQAQRALAERFQKKVSIEALLIKLSLPALQQFPEFNATLNGQELILNSDYNIGVAVDTSDGLIVPVVRGADMMDLPQLLDHLTDLLDRTIQRKTSPDELAGATFTVNNLGALGFMTGTSIIPYGTTAILSVGRAIEKPVVRERKVCVRPVMEVMVSFDHRVIDGGLCQGFMERLKEALEQPDPLLM